MNTAERKIKVALNKAVEFRNGGDSPTEAVSKAASVESLSPDMTERLVESFNIALTNATIGKAEDKTASFPLADRDQVMAKVFDVYEKKKSKKEASESSVDFFTEEMGETGDSWLNNRDKFAELDNPTEMIRQVIGSCQEAEKQISKYAQDVLAASIKMEGEFMEICDIASCSDFLGKFAAFEMQALSEYGEDVRPIVDNIYEVAGMGRFAEPRFSGSVKIASEYFPGSKIYSAFDRLMQATTEYHKSEIDRDHKVAELKELEKETISLMHEAASNDYSFSLTPKSAASILSGSVDSDFWKEADEKKDKPKPKSPSLIGSLGGIGKNPLSESKGRLNSVWEGAGKDITEQYQQAHSQATENYYNGPKEEVKSEMDNVRRQAILRELMSNDDIISKVDPRHIEQSYNTLLTMAPDLTLQPSVVQGWLRQSTATQSVDPYMAKQLLDLQQGVLKNKALSSGDSQ